jgi:hypothetical protein
MVDAHQSILDSVKAEMVILPLVRNNTTVLSKFIDTLENDVTEVAFLLQVGATDCLVDCKIQESVNADGSSASDVSGGAITQISATGDNVECHLSVRKTTLTKRYVGILVTISNATGANVCAEALAVPGSGNVPVVQAVAGANHYATSQTVKI